MRKLIPIAFLVLAILVFSQALWVSQFIRQERTNFQSSIIKELRQIINFHATEKFGLEDSENPNKQTLTFEDASLDTTINDQDAIAVYHLDTKNYGHLKSNFSELVSNVFADLALSQQKFHLKQVDSLFQENFIDFGQIASYKMLLLKNGEAFDSISYQNWNTNDTLLIKIPLGTEGTYSFEGSFQIKNSAFVRNLITSIGIAAFAIILVAFFIGWQLIALQKSKRKLEWKQKVVAGIVHDLKSPLAHVYTVLDFFSQTEQNELKKEQLTVAGSRVKLLTEKIAHTLSVFKAQDGNITLNIATYALREKCVELIEELQKTYANKEITTALSIPDNLQLKVDELYFDSVLRNLIENAIKYSSENVQLSISAEIGNKKIYLHIADNGQGIAREEQKKVFKEYYRSKNTTSKGHGIGLSFTKMIVQKHKGMITLHSELGKGSTFTLCFPKTIIV
ncbi:histidine kinase/DNA gyrase B/HSP90-like ATPase [Balneicella halophila]|uniref:histidine kinase n=1 Tax=Balneicella halophila TaxID=1537566 RepID=A0A7L4UQZ0_BALHA|nr:HAMP domain-containing sensor histidine kinase [Balneicella halophila]PVX51932.1 histidine kinase/DNA gyrase B/HSP90-like ATPase [Balneicella halophila]